MIGLSIGSASVLDCEERSIRNVTTDSCIPRPKTFLPLPFSLLLGHIYTANFGYHLPEPR